MPVFNDIRAVLAQVFGVPSEKIDRQSSPDTIPAWDSLGHFQLIAALEGRFTLKFTLREIQTMDSVARIEAVLAARGIGTP